MGIVWRAHDESLDRPVAVKEFVYTDTDGTNGADATSERHRVMREGRIAARLQHPHAVNVYNVVEDDGRPWLIMEYQSSRSLADVIAERGPLQPAEVVSIGRQLAAALTAAHAAGIVHRDVKPGNVLVAADGTAKLTDFGISHAVGDGTMTTTGEIAGTPAFFAPEVARGEQATFASDVFSLGSTLYNAVEGAPPFPHSDNQIALLYRVATGEVRPAGRAGVLAPVLRQLLQSDPAFRPDTNAARAALTTVEREQQQPPRGPTTMATPINAAATPSRGRATKVAIGAIVLLAATTVTLILGFTPGSDDNRSAAGSPAATHSERVDAPMTPTSTSSASSSTAPPDITTTTSSTGDPATTATEALRAYYSSIPGNLRAGYSQLTDSFKSSRSPSFSGYREFWGQYADVKISDVDSQGSNRVSATITYVAENGNTQVEHHLYTLVHTADGWAINGQRMY